MWPTQTGRTGLSVSTPFCGFGPRDCRTALCPDRSLGSRKSRKQTLTKSLGKKWELDRKIIYWKPQVNAAKIHFRGITVVALSLSSLWDFTRLITLHDLNDICEIATYFSTPNWNLICFFVFFFFFPPNPVCASVLCQSPHVQQQAFRSSRTVLAASKWREQLGFHFHWESAEEEREGREKRERLLKEKTNTLGLLNYG